MCAIDENQVVIVNVKSDNIVTYDCMQEKQEKGIETGLLDRIMAFSPDGKIYIRTSKSLGEEHFEEHFEAGRS